MLSRLESTETPLSEEEIDVRQLMRELETEARALSRGNHVISVEADAARIRGSHAANPLPLPTWERTSSLP